MATVDEFKEAIKESLDRTGAMHNIRAKIRAEIFQALKSPTDFVAKPKPSKENLIINELIREYLIFNGYRETLSVFLPGHYFTV